MQSASLPDPEQLFDSLLARKEFKEHPAKISSILFYLASIIIHGMALASDLQNSWTRANEGQISFKPTLVIPVHL